VNDTSLVGAAGTAAGGGGGGGTVDQGAAGVASWKVVEDNSASVKTAVEAIELQLPPARGPQLEADSLSVTVVSQATYADAPTETTLAAILIDTGNVSTASTSVDTKTPELGQATMVGSTPVVIASDQSPVTVSGPLTDAQIRATALPVSLAGTLLADNTSTPTAPSFASFGMLYDGTNWDLQRGDGSGRTVVAGNVADNSPAALPVTIGGEDTNGRSWPIVGANVGSGLQPYVQVTNQVDTELPAAASLTDNTSNPTAPAVGAFAECWDGTAWQRLHGTSQGAATVAIDRAHLGPFGDLIAEAKVPIIQIDFVYGINAQTGTSAASGTGAAVDTNASRLRLQNGTSAAGSASYTSVRLARYRPGQGTIARFTAAFVASAANSTQIVGMGDASNGFFFGYNGTAFGILHRNAGVDTWVAQTAWNVDRVNGSGGAANRSGANLTLTSGNVFVISYPFLGYGNVFFYVEDPTTGNLIHVHTIRYAGSSASVELTQPTLPFFARALSTTSTTNLTIYVGSVGVFIVGQRAFVGVQGAADNSKPGVTTETNILTLRNATTVNGVTNRVAIRIRSLSFAGDGGNGISTLRIYKGATVGGTPAFTPFSGSTADNGVTITNAQSVVSVDIAGTTISGGTKIFNGVVSRSQHSALFDATNLDILILPGERATFSVQCGASSTAAVTVNWHEDT